MFNKAREAQWSEADTLSFRWVLFPCEQCDGCPAGAAWEVPFVHGNNHLPRHQAGSSSTQVCNSTLLFLLLHRYLLEQAGVVLDNALAYSAARR